MCRLSAACLIIIFASVVPSSCLQSKHGLESDADHQNSSYAHADHKQHIHISKHGTASSTQRVRDAPVGIKHERHKKHSHTLHASSTYARVAGEFHADYWTSVLWSLPVVIFGLVLPQVLPSSTGIPFGFTSAILWGVKGYLLAVSSYYAGLYPESVLVGIDYLSWVWALGIVSCICFHFVFDCSSGAPYRREIVEIPNLYWGTLVAYAFAGFPVFFGEIFLQVGFGENTEASGPNYAIASAYGLVVTPFFFFYADERLSVGQLVGLMGVLAGVFIMGFTDFAAVGFSLLVLLFWSLDAIAYRLAGMWGSPPCLGVLLRLVFMCLTGVCAVIFRQCQGASLPTLGMLAVPLYNSIIDGLSIYSLARAFEAPDCKTGIVSSILCLQTIVMSFLNLWIMQWEPMPSEWLGSTVVVVSCGIMCMSDHNLPQDDNKEDVFEGEARVVKKTLTKGAVAG